MAMNENDLRGLQRKISQIEKDKHRIEGKLESELKALAALISDDCQPNRAEAAADALLDKLKKKKKKAQKAVDNLFLEIETQAEKLGIEI